MRHIGTSHYDDKNRDVHQWGFLVDVERCLGCRGCEVACKVEHGAPPGNRWRRVYLVNDERHPDAPTYGLSMACNHCRKPQCLEVCPAGAYDQRGDGIVTHDAQRCLGCKYCTWACPFGAPSINPFTRKAQKCQLCFERLDRGQLPFCVESCPVGALQLVVVEPVGAGVKIWRGPGYRLELALTGREMAERVPGVPTSNTHPSLVFGLPRARGDGSGKA